MHTFISTSPDEAICITSASDKQRTGALRMKFDKGDRYFDKGSFEYVEDPTIESAESGPPSQVCKNKISYIPLLFFCIFINSMLFDILNDLKSILE